MNSVIARFSFFVIVFLSLTACSETPSEKAHRQVVSLGCSVGTADAFSDFTNKNVDLNYNTKEELKLFNFADQYPVSDVNKEGLKQLFRLSARGCYLDTIRKQNPTTFK
jgi:hypothetical protein